MISKCGYIEYKMPEAVAKDLLKKRSGNDLKMTPNDYLCKFVNEEYDLLGECIRVIRY